MKHARTFWIITLLVLVTSQTYAALNAYLQLKSTTGKKTYRCKIDANGKFSFSDVEPDTYDLIFVLDGTKSQDDGTIQSIEISSFSWGASNMASKSTPVTRSNISNNRTATVDAQGPTVISNGKRVATGDVNGDGIADKISSPVIWSPKSNIYSTLTDVIFHEVTVTNVTKVEGALKAGWNLKENVK